MSVQTPNATARAISCTDELRALNFLVAGDGVTTDDVVRVFVRNADGTGVTTLAVLQHVAGGVRITELHPNVTLYRANRLVTGSGRLLVGEISVFTANAGTAGRRTDLLTLRVNGPLALNGTCRQVGIEIVRGASTGKTSLVISDMTVRRTELPGDRQLPGVGLIAGLTGGFPTGKACTEVCLPCPVGLVTLSSAASYATVEFAPDSIVAAFGADLALDVGSALSLPLPTTLAGTSVRVRDSQGVERDAGLFYVSPGQINMLIPRDTALGQATIIVRNGAGRISTTAVQIVSVAPGLFASNSTGTGLAAGFIHRVRPNGQVIIEELGQFVGGNYVPRPIDVGLAGDQVFLVLSATGIRFRSSLSAVTATIGGDPVNVLYAGAQGSFEGLDQVNILLTPALAGRGEVQIELTVEGKRSNQVSILIR